MSTAGPDRGDDQGDPVVSDEALEQLRSALAEAYPASVTTPAWVRERVDSALDAERDHAAKAPSEPAPVVPLRRRLAPRLLAAAVALGVVAFGGYALGQNSVDTPTAAEQSGTDDDWDTATTEPGDDMAQLDSPEAERSEPENDTMRAPSQDDGTALGESVVGLQAAVREVADAGESLRPECGQPLADGLAAELLGSTEAGDAGVLVVVRDQDGVLNGWLVPACEATEDDAQLEVSVRE
ncbi:MAG TPA: hypothetical protein VK053_25740 [Jiangellaceae bacterium]|nr:hypothetical protein [Jiangellaceae bacterium]